MKSVFHCQSCDFSPLLILSVYKISACLVYVCNSVWSLVFVWISCAFTDERHTSNCISLPKSEQEWQKTFFVLSGNCLTFQSWLNWRKRESCNWTAVSVSKCFLMVELCGSPLCKRLNSVVFLQSFSKLSNQRNMNGKIRLFSFKLRCQL